MPDLYQNAGKVRTDCYCHNCSKNFCAVLDYDIDGDHVIECPWCGHEHCRTIAKGRVTLDRFDSRSQRPQVVVDKRNVWKSSVIQAKSTSSSQYLSDLWSGRES